MIAVKFQKIRTAFVGARAFLLFNTNLSKYYKEKKVAWLKRNCISVPG